LQSAAFRLFSRQVEILLPNRSKQEAIDLFHAFQHSHALAPRHILANTPEVSIKLVLCPFWSFKVSASASYLAEIGFDAAREEHTDVRRSQQWSTESIHMHPGKPEMLVPASYIIRRDLLEGLKPMLSCVPTSSARACMDAGPQLHVQTATLPLDGQLVDKIASVAGLQCSEVEVQELDVRQSIAWQLALRNLRLQQVRTAPT
jgi:hypothetical protein